jgi:hypothetical protein
MKRASERRFAECPRAFRRPPSRRRAETAGSAANWFKFGGAPTISNDFLVHFFSLSLFLIWQHEQKLIGQKKIR